MVATFLLIGISFTIFGIENTKRLARKGISFWSRDRPTDKLSIEFVTPNNAGIPKISDQIAEI